MSAPARSRFCPVCHGTGTLGYTLTEVAPCWMCRGEGVLEPMPEPEPEFDWLDAISDRALRWLVILLLALVLLLVLAA